MVNPFILLQVIDGERLTLTLWFTRDCSHDEDAKVINILSQRIQYEPDSFLPLPASSTMYWFQKDGSGFDVRHARVSFLGYDFSSSKEKSRADNSLCDPLELLDGRLYLARGDEVLVQKFLNSLHALQVIGEVDFLIKGLCHFTHNHCPDFLFVLLSRCWFTFPSPICCSLKFMVHYSFDHIRFYNSATGELLN